MWKWLTQMFLRTASDIEAEKHRQRVIDICNERDYLVVIESGDWVYWPPVSAQGYQTSADLRVIADELDRRNAEWERMVEQNLKTLAPVVRTDGDF